MPIFGAPLPQELELQTLRVRELVVEEGAQVGTLGVVGFAVDGGPLTLPGSILCDSLACLDGNLSVNDGTLSVSGNAAIGGALGVTGAVTAADDLNVGGALGVDGDSELAGVAVPGRLNQTIDGAPYALPASFEAVGPSDTLSNSASALTFTPGLNFPAGMMNAGAILEVESWGRVSSALVPGTARVIVRFGSGLGANLFGTSFVPLAASQSNAAWHYRARFRCTAAGAAGTINATCQEIYLPNTTQRPAPINGLAFNTTDTAILRTVFQFTTADAANSATMDGMIARLYRGPEA